MYNEDFLREAIQLSAAGVQTAGAGPFGAVIVRDQQIFGRGFNTVVATNDPTAHAEVVAIRDACATLKTFDLSGCEIYTSCEPCPMCLGAIYWARLDRIYYGADRQDAATAGFADQHLYNEMVLPINARSIPMTQSLHQEACDVFATWLKKPDRTQY